MRQLRSAAVTAILLLAASFFAALSSAPANAGTCQLLSRTCTDSGTKSINGLPIYRDCWNYAEQWQCVETNNQDYCAPLVKGGCGQISAVPTQVAFNGDVLQTTAQYQCYNERFDNLPGVIFQGTTYQIRSESINDSACSAYSSSSDCAQANQVCTQGPETRNINGLDIYRDCWAWQRTYQCLTNNQTSDCTEYQNNPKCQLVGTSPVQDTNAPNGAPTSWINTYKCEIKPAQTNEVQVCGNLNPDKDFGMVVALMETAREGAAYGDVASLTMFNGKPQECSRLLGNTISCCGTMGLTPDKIKAGGAIPSNQGAGTIGTAMYLSAGAKVVGAVSNILGSGYAFDALANAPTAFSTIYGVAGVASQSAAYLPNFTAGYFSATSAQATSMWGQMFSGADATAAAGFTSAATTGTSLGGVYGLSLTFYGTTAAAQGAAAGSSFAFSAGNFVVAFNPATFAFAIATQFALNWLSNYCQPEIKNNIPYIKAMNLSYTVGQYCNKRILGFCVETKDGMCVYNSHLAKLINIQGKAQLGIGWGSAQAPNCTGFTQAQIAQLDFSKMDFGEFIADVLPKAINQAAGLTGANLNSQLQLSTAVSQYSDSLKDRQRPGTADPPPAPTSNNPYLGVPQK
ncbi:conjugal transfer protein TraN [Burkholderia cepacia]|uniref:conjugal transfer protein TraN n=1 Tax=Burkholderia cepacia TaxID=292 RepID=UPI002AB65EF2|nr:conjugal transfer protein TraN [Burkholderia cepacia]